MPVALAQTAQSSAHGGGAIEEVVVTANRHHEKISDLPFNISAFSAQQLTNANITSITSLSNEVPNFVITDAGAGRAESSIPIMRGINASQPVVTSDRFFQSPVGMYLGNSPITGSLPLQDVKRIEVLRGPQGTLYGAGSLAGTIRIIPNEPDLNRFSGFVSGSIAAVAHSNSYDNDLLGVLNIPLTSNFAVRIVAERQYSAGFIDQFGIMKRQNGNYVSGVPILANPADVAGSPAVYFNAKDVNFTRISSGRASFLWKPNEKAKIVGSYSYAHTVGDGAPMDNNTYQGGVSPIDSRLTLPPTGDWQISLPMEQPYNRTTELASLDVSYDVGFATLTTTLSYGHTQGKLATDQTVTLLGTPYGFYYTGAPANPRTVIPVTNPDSEDTYSEEMRLVSKEGGEFGYVVGAFFQQDTHFIGLDVWNAGANTQSAAAHGGSTLPVILGGTYIPLFPNNSVYVQNDLQNFNDYALYGNLTWHLNSRWQATAGVRGFYETFSQRQHAASSLFLFNYDTASSSHVTDAIFKVDTIYKLTQSSNIYATWSQGFRRGGSNSFVTQGPVMEPTQLLNYQPDKTNNYEVGIKGNWSGLYYSVDGFYIDWLKPQIDLLTPYNLTAVVVNGNAASSKGFEAELSGPLGHGFSFNVSAAYSKARLTQNFSLPAGSGVGTIIPNAITGKKGDRLPGTPDLSASGNVQYTTGVGAGDLTFILGADYRGSTVNLLPSINPNTPATTSPGYALLHGSIEYDMNHWTLQLYGTNLADSHVEIAKTIRTLSSYATLGNWGNSFLVARPREIGLRLTWRF
jgi:outer membrane receptor protein involved in Fe transport